VTEDEATEAITSALGEVQLITIFFLSLRAERSESNEPVGPGESFPMNINANIGRNSEGHLVYRVTFDVERPDVAVHAESVAAYKVGDSLMWDDSTVQRVFGGRIAVPAVLPIARAKIREMTNDMGIIPVLLGIYEPKPLQAKP
jgi:hypothetical protein